MTRPLVLCAALVLLGCDSEETTAGTGGSGAGDPGGSGGVGGSGGEGGSGGSGGTVVPQAFSDACAVLHAKRCEGLEACLATLAEATEGPADDCVARWQAACERMYRPGLDPADLLACADALATDCDSVVRYEFGLGPMHALVNPATPPACSFTGELPDGSDCELGHACQSGFCHYPDLAATCGTCTQPPAKGDPCIAGCGHGLWCIEGTCVAPGELGDPCEEPGQPCHPDLWCDEGTCDHRVAAGAPCVVNAPACSLGDLVCNAETDLCEPWGPSQPVGGACGYQPDGSAQLCVSSVCEATTGSCVPLKQHGEPCTQGTYWFIPTDCALPLACIDGTCQYDGDVMRCD